MQRTASLCGMLLLMCVGIADSSYAGTFGLTFFDQGYAGGANPTIDVQNLPQLSYSDSFSTSGVTGSAAFSGSISGGLLRAYSFTSNPDYGEAYSNADLYVFDTFHIAGPTGSTGRFTFNMVFDGTVAETGTGQAGLSDGYNLLANGTVIPGIEYSGIVNAIYKVPGSASHESSSVTLDLSAGTSVVIGELLQIRNDEVGEGLVPYPPTLPTCCVESHHLIDPIRS